MYEVSNDYIQHVQALKCLFHTFEMVKIEQKAENGQLGFRIL